MILQKMYSDNRHVQFLKKMIEDLIINNKIESVKRFNIKLSHITYSLYITNFGIIEDGLQFRRGVHLVISRNKYLMEKLIGIDIVAIIENHFFDMKLSIKWEK